MSELLRHIPLFNKLTKTALKEVEKILQRQELKTGENLFNYGDAGNKLIIVEKGKIAIFLPQESGRQETIRTFGPGEVLGEMSLIDEEPRSASAFAAQDSTIFTLNKSDFQKLLDANPQMVYALMCGLNDRIRYTTNFIGEVSRWISKIAEGDLDAENFMGADAGFPDESLSNLAEGFVRMAASVKQREDQLRKEVTRLSVIIDQAKRKQDVDEIAQSEFFKSLKASKEDKE